MKAHPVDRGKGRSTRLNLTLSPRTATRLDELQEITDAVSGTEVVRTAIRLYDYLICEVQKGNDLCIRDKDGKITALKVFY